MKLFIYILVTAVFFSLVCFVLLKLYLSERTKRKKAEEDKKQLQKNISYLVHHAEELANIRLEKEKTDKKIEEAKTDEEVSDIVNAIINGNNDRVRK